MLSENNGGSNAVEERAGVLNPLRKISLKIARPVGTLEPASGGQLSYKSKPTAEPEAEMEALSFEYARTRNSASREQLILHHQRLVHYVAARFLGSGETLEDLVQVGNIGLINAVDRFDPAQNVKFSTYALPTIMGEIKRHFRDKTWHVKVPRWLQELSLAAKKAEQTLALRLGRMPTVCEIAAEIGASEDNTLEALGIGQIATAVSLDTRLDPHSGGDSATLLDIVGYLDTALRDAEAYADLRRALDFLDVRERQVIHLRFFDELSQAKIARQLCISQMHVSRLQQRALMRLREILVDEPTRPELRKTRASSAGRTAVRS